MENQSKEILHKLDQISTKFDRIENIYTELENIRDKIAAISTHVDFSVKYINSEPNGLISEVAELKKRIIIIEANLVSVEKEFVKSASFIAGINRTTVIMLGFLSLVITIATILNLFHIIK